MQNLDVARALYPNFVDGRISFNCTIASFKVAEETHAYFVGGQFPFDTRYLTAGYAHWGMTGPQRDAKVADQASRHLLTAFRNAVIRRECPDGFIRSLFESLLIQIHQRSRGPISGTPYPNGICIPGLRRLFCSSDGAFTVCERIKPGVVLGNVDIGVSFDRVMDTVERYIRLSTEDCRGCWAVRFCSLCFCHAFEDGWNIDVKRTHCIDVKETIANAFQFYFAILEEDETAFDYLDGINIV
jgi:radical SAM protein with 4Fe4S-binding SPASM domain